MCDDVELASESATGWTLGLGVEHAFTDNWLGRFEYRYYDFGDNDFNDFGGLGRLCRGPGADGNGWHRLQVVSRIPSR